MTIRRNPTPPRRGLSLLEVIVALAIFLFSLVAISQLMDQGANMAVEMDERSHAAMLVQSKLAELSAGSEQLVSHGESAIDGETDWYWSLTAEADTVPGLYRVAVTVHKDTPRGRVEVTFSQIVLDPNQRGSTDSSSTGADSTNTTNGGGQ